MAAAAVMEEARAASSSLPDRCPIPGCGARVKVNHINDDDSDEGDGEGLGGDIGLVMCSNVECSWPWPTQHDLEDHSRNDLGIIAVDTRSVARRKRETKAEKRRRKERGEKEKEKEKETKDAPVSVSVPVAASSDAFAPPLPPPPVPPPRRNPASMTPIASDSDDYGDVSDTEVDFSFK